MKSINKELVISGYPPHVEVTSKMLSFGNELIEGMRNLIVRAKRKHAEARLNIYYKKRQMHRQLYQNPPNQIPLDMKLRMGMCR